MLANLVSDASVVGYLFFLAYWIVCVYVVKNGGGKHQWNMRMEEFIDMLSVRLPTLKDSKLPKSSLT